MIDYRGQNCHITATSQGLSDNVSKTKLEQIGSFMLRTLVRSSLTDDVERSTDIKSRIVKERSMYYHILPRFVQLQSLRSLFVLLYL